MKADGFWTYVAKCGQNVPAVNGGFEVVNGDPVRPCKKCFKEGP